MKILVTGAKGQIARSLVECAEQHTDIHLQAVGRPILDLVKPGSAAALIEAVRPDVVINAAAYTGVDQAEDEPELAFQINAEGAHQVAAAAAGIGAAVVQLSTDYVFDGRSKVPYREDSSPHPLGVYGKSKFAGEESVRAANARHVILRTAWVYSPFGRNFVKTIMDAANSLNVLTVVNDQIGTPTSALDLAEGLLQVIERWKNEPDFGMGETYHLAGTGETSWFGLAEFVMDECRKRSLPSAEVRPIQTADWPTKAVRPANSALDSRKFGGDFDFVTPPWQESVSAVVARLAGTAI